MKRLVIKVGTAVLTQGEELALQRMKNLVKLISILKNDKNLEEILPLFPQDAIYYFCKPDISRGLDAKILKEKAAKFNLIGKTYTSVSNAYQKAKENALPNDCIYIGGSTFVVAEIL